MTFLPLPSPVRPLPRPAVIVGLRPLPLPSVGPGPLHCFLVIPTMTTVTIVDTIVINRDRVVNHSWFGVSFVKYT